MEGLVQKNIIEFILLNAVHSITCTHVAISIVSSNVPTPPVVQRPVFEYS